MSAPAFSIAAGCVGFAALHCYADPGRDYLKGVLVEPCPAGGVIAVATDGHTLIAFHDPDGSAPRPAILRCDAGLLALMRERPDAPLSSTDCLEPGLVARLSLFHACDDEDELEPSVDAAGFAEVMEGDFPAWRRAVPASVPSGASPAPSIQARFYGRFAGPARWNARVENAALLVRQNGRGPALVLPGFSVGGKPWIGCVMPMECDPPEMLPAWLGETGKRERAS